MAITRDKLQGLLKYMHDQKIKISDVLNLTSNESMVPLLNASKETELVDLTDVLYVQQHKHNVYEIGTANGTYTYNKRDIDIMGITHDNGNFEYLEKNLLVNMREIKKYDSYMEIVYFTDYHKSKDAAQVRIKGVTMRNLRSRGILGADKDVTEKQPEEKILSCRQVSKSYT